MLPAATPCPGRVDEHAGIDLRVVKHKVLGRGASPLPLRALGEWTDRQGCQSKGCQTQRSLSLGCLKHCARRTGASFVLPHYALNIGYNAGVCIRQ